MLSNPLPALALLADPTALDAAWAGYADINAENPAALHRKTDYERALRHLAHLYNRLDAKRHPRRHDYHACIVRQIQQLERRLRLDQG